MARNQQSLIARLMCEDFDDTEVSGVMEVFTDSVPDDLKDDRGEEKLTAEQLKIAKRFLDLMGSVEKAQEALDKVSECEDVLRKVDDEEFEERETDQIAGMAHLIPDLPDLPGGVGMGFAAGGGAQVYTGGGIGG
jgi:hypothetical protein